MTPSDRLDDWAKAQIAKWRIPGMVCGVYRNGEPEYVAAYGYADLEHGVPMKRESVCEICSITKQFTAACVLLLQEEGELSLSDAAAKHLPNMPRVWHSITLDELLHHTSGINDDRFNLYDTALTPEVLAAAATAISRGPGEAWEYSNLGYRMLGDVVANVSGQPYFDFLHARILEPLGLNDTQPNSERAIPNRVRGYGFVGDNLVNAPTLSDQVGGATGGLVSTVADLNRWSSALMGGELLRPESRAAMLTPGLLSSGDIARPPFSPGGYGLGVNLSELAGRRLEKHAGGWDDASAQLTRVLDDRLTVAVLTNFGGWQLRPWVGEIVASMFLPGWSLPRLEPRPDPNPAPLATLAKALEELRSGTLSTRYVSARWQAHWTLNVAYWSKELETVKVKQAQFVEHVTQGVRELMIYRQGGDSPLLVVAGFAPDGKLDSLATSPLPE